MGLAHRPAVVEAVDLSIQVVAASVRNQVVSGFPWEGGLGLEESGLHQEPLDCYPEGREHHRSNPWEAVHWQVFVEAVQDQVSVGWQLPDHPGNWVLSAEWESLGDEATFPTCSAYQELGLHSGDPGFHGAGSGPD